MELPTGFRFYPTEEELINFYLLHKLNCCKPEIDRVIPSIDICKFEPVQIPELAGQLCQGETEQWFFFVPRQEREARGGRPNRTTATGYWKATGSTSLVYSSDTKVIGIKKTMVFYKGKAPTGSKTKWKMNEYKAIKQEDNNIINNIIGQNHNANIIVSSSSTSSSTIIPQVRNEMSLCRVYVTSGCARAFDRRPPAGSLSSLTTTSLNNINYTISTTQNVVNTSSFDYTHMEIGQGSGTTLSTTAAQIAMDNNEDYDSSNNLGGDDHHGTHQGSVAAVEGCNNNNTSNSCCDDIEMTQSLDNLIDWEQLDWL